MVLKKRNGWRIALMMAIMFIFASGFPAMADEKSLETKEKKAEDKKENGQSPTGEQLHYEVTVTATRARKDTFVAPNPVSVASRQKIRETAANNVMDVLTEFPGVDVNGVGPSQSRPIIRGFRGQRILLMEDGIRLNSSRRQQDFGEIPSLVDISEVERVEVVRGPASVLYGSDAIGGVVNIITRTPVFDPNRGFDIHGDIGYRYSTADSQNKATANIAGYAGRFSFSLGGNYRDAKDYKAPAGSFGDITLPEEVTVVDSGVRDHGLNVQLNYNFSDKHRLGFKYEYYRADDTGFGLVEPELYDPGSARIQIRYPEQQVNNLSLFYENSDIRWLLADHLSFRVYRRSNIRDLAMNVFVPFNIPRLPGAGVQMDSNNHTDINTTGFRLEFNKAIKNHLLTYGVDYFVDDTLNTDSNITQMVKMGPPKPTVDNTPDVPNSWYRSVGAFIQDDISILSNLSLILGVRYQSVNAETRNTPGLETLAPADSLDETLVGAANISWGVSDQLRLVATIGRGFRSPNLIERFFNGPTPEGSGYQSRNPHLSAETSLNFDLGFKYRWQNIYAEGSWFNNTVYDGIRVVPTGNKVMGRPEYQNINVDKLRMWGVEFLAKYIFNFGLSVGVNFTYMKSKDLGNPETPYVDNFSTRINLNARYEPPSRDFWISYSVRIYGDQKDVLLVDNPIGTIIPGFATHSAGFGVTLFKKSAMPQTFGLMVENLTNALYSEFSNASFFRPAPKRRLALTWSARF